MSPSTVVGGVDLAVMFLSLLRLLSNAAPSSALVCRFFTLEPACRWRWLPQCHTCSYSFVVVVGGGGGGVVVVGVGGGGVSIQNECSLAAASGFLRPQNGHFCRSTFASAVETQ